MTKIVKESVHTWNGGRNSENTMSAMGDTFNNVKFYPGVVTDVFSSFDDPGCVLPDHVGSIMATRHTGGGMVGMKGLVKKRYYPLLRGINDIPVKGEGVLLIDDINDVGYYLGPLNTTNHPCFNPDPLNVNKNPNPIKTNFKPDNSKIKEQDSVRDKINMPKNYPLLPIARMQKPWLWELDDPTLDRQGEDGSIAKEQPFGDMVLEGRHGNSIRMGSRNKYPLIYISNGRNVFEPIENLNNGTLIAMTSLGSIPQHFNTLNYDLGCLNPSLDNPRKICDGNTLDDNDNKNLINEFNYNYGTDSDNVPIVAPQLFMTSGRITFDSSDNDINLSAFNNINIGSGNNLTINTKNHTTIESSNIYLGKTALTKEEPLVLGKQLKTLLDEFIVILKMFKVTGTVGGISGTPSPDVIFKIEEVENKLSNPSFWSEYHFIENNGQK